MTRADLDPQAEGSSALWRNAARRSNPYAVGSEARREWDVGYCRAMSERYGASTREDVGLPPRTSPPQFTRAYR